MIVLVSNELLRHSDNDVKVAVASCINEIMRITAPDAPYDDDQMKVYISMLLIPRATNWAVFIVCFLKSIVMIVIQLISWYTFGVQEVFQLIVSSFEKPDDKSSLSYLKRTSILDTVAKVRSCVVMLDLECDALILDMFKNFFRTIR